MIMTGVAEGVVTITASIAGKSANAVLTVQGSPDIQVTGRVIDGQTQLGLAGAQVELPNGSHAVTLADGTYSFSVPFAQRSIPATVTATLTGYQSTGLRYLSVTAPSAQLESIILVRATGLASSISGAVRNARDNSPIPGATVILYRGQGAQTNGVIDTTTDSQGGYSFTNQNTGTYTVLAIATGFANCSRTAIALPSGSAIIQDVTCSPIGST